MKNAPQIFAITKIEPPHKNAFDICTQKFKCVKAEEKWPNFYGLVVVQNDFNKFLKENMDIEKMNQTLLQMYRKNKAAMKS